LSSIWPCEGIFVDHYPIQFENYRNNYAGSFYFYNQKGSGGSALATKNKPQQTIGQAHQGKGKRKGGDCLPKNCATRSTCSLRRLQGFERNVCNEITNINPCNLD
jgi:hypothetical protein